MGSYIPSTPPERRQMLEAIGLESMEGLFAQIPKEMRIRRLDLPEGRSEQEVAGLMESIAGKNRVFPSIFRGAGAYNHYIPSIVKSIVSKEEFVTAYTPYQAEISQGVLQSIFEYQTMMCELTGMEISNASVYDGASAAAEAVAMCHERSRTKALVCSTANPIVIQTIRTYCEGSGTEVVLVPSKDGLCDTEALSRLLDNNTACVYLQQPNFYGLLEDATGIGVLAHAAGVRFIMGVHPIACAVMKTPGECGADIAVGEGQPLGMPLSFGGPYLGFITCTKEMMRKIPGRVVGETADIEGKRAFVLTLQAREQHIRREKASSNICSNQALCAMTAAAYLCAMGPDGIREAASQCLSKAHYAAKAICSVPGFQLRYRTEFFQEFVTSAPIPSAELLSMLENHGILGGYPVEDGLLWCVTECNSKAQIDALVELLKGACVK